MLMLKLGAVDGIHECGHVSTVDVSRCSDSDGFSAGHSSREYGYYEQFRGFRSGPERRYD